MGSYFGYKEFTPYSVNVNRPYIKYEERSFVMIDLNGTKRYHHQSCKNITRDKPLLVFENQAVQMKYVKVTNTLCDCFD